MSGERLKARDVCYRYPGATSLAVDHCSLSLKPGTVTALTGLTASGKTTLGLILKGLIKPDSGKILLEGAGMKTMDPSLRWDDRGEGMNALDSGSSDAPTSPTKRCIHCSSFNSSNQSLPLSNSPEILSPNRLNQIVGWAGAHPEIQIFAATVREEIAFGLKHRGLSGGDLERKVVQALDMVGLDPAEHLDRNPFSLSGGKRRLIALASIAVIDYDWYIFDEPTAGLDLFGFRAVQRLVRSLADNGKGVCLISHDDIFLGGVTDVRVEMRGGKRL